MTEACILAASCTKFAKRPEQTFRDLTREVYLAALAYGGLDGAGIAVDELPADLARTG